MRLRRPACRLFVRVHFHQVDVLDEFGLVEGRALGFPVGAVVGRAAHENFEQDRQDEPDELHGFG